MARLAASGDNNGIMSFPRSSHSVYRISHSQLPTIPSLAQRALVPRSWYRLSLAQIARFSNDRTCPPAHRRYNAPHRIRITIKHHNSSDTAGKDWPKSCGSPRFICPAKRPVAESVRRLSQLTPVVPTTRRSRRIEHVPLL